MNDTLRGTELKFRMAAVPEAVHALRYRARQCLADRVPTGVADDCELILAELVTNPLLHCPAGERAPVMLRLDDGILLVEAADSASRPPSYPPAMDVDEDGRSRALSSNSGWKARRDGLPGKAVWSTLALP